MMSHCRLFLCWPSRWPAKCLTAAHSITHHGDSSILLPKLITGARTSEAGLLLLCGGEDGLGYRAFSQDLGGETWRKTVTIQTLPLMFSIHPILKPCCHLLGGTLQQLYQFQHGSWQARNLHHHQPTVVLVAVTGAGGGVAIFKSINNKAAAP